MVELKGFEPLASCVQGRRSSQLSYSPDYVPLRPGLPAAATFKTQLKFFVSNNIFLKTELYDASVGLPLPVSTPSTYLRGLAVSANLLFCRFYSVCGLLLRKEVIQPQVPLRLPCYDFIPVTNHTLDASLSVKSWVSGFGCNQLP